jgi:hypothetical protein
MTNDSDTNQLAKLAERLLDGTRLRSVHWRPAEVETYTWGTTDGSVTIASRDRDGEPPYELAIFNPENVKVDTLKSDLLPGDVPAPWNGALADLYAAARRDALGADDLIDALMRGVRLAAPEDERRRDRSLLHRNP